MRDHPGCNKCDKPFAPAAFDKRTDVRAELKYRPTCRECLLTDVNGITASQRYRANQVCSRMMISHSARSNHDVKRLQCADEERSMIYHRRQAANGRRFRAENPDYFARLSAKMKADVHERLKIAHRAADARGIQWQTEDEPDFIEKMTGPCAYCGYLPTLTTQVRTSPSRDCCGDCLTPAN